MSFTLGLRSVCSGPDRRSSSGMKTVSPPRAMLRCGCSAPAAWTTASSGAGPVHDRKVQIYARLYALGAPLPCMEGLRRSRATLVDDPAPVAGQRSVVRKTSCPSRAPGTTFERLKQAQGMRRRFSRNRRSERTALRQYPEAASGGPVPTRTLVRLECGIGSYRRKHLRGCQSRSSGRGGKIRLWRWKTP